MVGATVHVALAPLSALRLTPGLPSVNFNLVKPVSTEGNDSPWSIS